MYNVSAQHLHFIGIGGVGMAGIAEVLLNLGYSVSGSDLKESALTKHLQSLGAQVVIGHRTENIPAVCSTVVLSSAVQQDNPEFLEAKNRGLPCIPRAEMLAELMRMKYGIAVAGSHGKTTTTSMAAKILRDCGFDPTVVIGGRVLSENSGARVGRGDFVVAEADESDGSFCLLRPAIAVVTNIDTEHLGHYGSFGALEESFFSFMSSVPFYGVVVACGDDPVLANLLTRLHRRVIKFGLSPENDIWASDITVERLQSTFTLHYRDSAIRDSGSGDSVSLARTFGPIRLPIPGAHMVSNSLAAIAVAVELGASIAQACQALESFAGVARRTQLISSSEGIAILDDYAHHPREIEATLTAVKQGWLSGGDGRLTVIFQPHRYSRTKELFHEFLTCFKAADRVIVGDIYAAGESEIAGITGESLAAAMQHPNVAFVPNLTDCVEMLRPQLTSGDVVITVGAGSVGQIAHQLAGIIDLPTQKKQAV